ncbi:aldo/keto reductase family protein [Geopyxis carbonaria]|nr:aldo/keto reductase family protein [Geopyxis carbonaria]
MSLGRTFTLANGVKIPAVGFGTFASEGADGESYTATMAALEAGYRHLDCAWFYQNEHEIGDAIRDFLAKRPDVKREDLFVCTKVWNHLHEPDEVEWSINSSLKKLGLDYVDLFLIHWPIAAERDESYMPRLNAAGQYTIKHELTADPTPTWRALEALYDAGKARAIGVSNFPIPTLEKLFATARIPPMVNQVEMHPFLPNNTLLAWCRAHGVQPVAYSPLGSQNQVPSTGEKVADNEALKAVARKSGRSLAQVLIAWGVRRGYPVLPKSANPDRIRGNFQDYEMPDEEFEAVESVARGRHVRFVNMKDTFGYDVWPEEVGGEL